MVEGIPVGSRVYTEVMQVGIVVGTYGEGTYIGDFTYPGGTSDELNYEYIGDGTTAPKIQLDQGGYAYGPDCYWFVIPAGWEAPTNLEVFGAPWNS